VVTKKTKVLVVASFFWETLFFQPGSISPMGRHFKSVQQGSCLWWLVRVAETAPNAPNVQLGVREKK
jgi:hypothetical protein